MPVAPELFDTQRWQRLRDTFADAVVADDDTRRQIVAAAERDDPELARALVELLHAARHDDTGGHAPMKRAIAAIGESFAPASGTRVGAYVLRERIGRGGMGSVFRAERIDGKLTREVAVKIVPRAMVDDDDVRRFLRERDLLAGLEHPHIAPLFDVGEADDGSPYFAMALVRGAPITAWCSSHALDVRARVSLFLDVCAAVQHAHSRLVLHRDLKPSNILVTDDGEARLIDFGIGKLIGDDAAQRTGTQQRFFSPANAAPEQVRGEAIGVACDVYQLGTVLYELLTGNTVFDLQALTPAALEQHIIGHVPMAPSDRAARADAAIAAACGAASPAALARQLRGDLDAIVLQCLRKDPGERYGSVEQLAGDLRRFLDLQPVAARRGHCAYRLRKFLRRHAIATAAVAAILLLTGAFVANTMLQSRQLRAERDRVALERDLAERVTGYLIAVFQSADPAVSLSRDAPISRVVGDAYERLQQDKDIAEAVRVRLLLALAQVHRSIEDYPRSLEILAAAAPLVQGDDDTQRRQRIAYLQELALSSNADGQEQAAYDAAAAAVALHEALGDPVATSFRSRRLEAEMSKFGLGSAVALEKFEALLASAGDDPRIDVIELAELQIGAAAQFERAGRADEAISALKAIEARLVAMGQKGRATWLDARLVEADVLSYGMLKHDEALAIQQEVLAEKTALYGERSASVAKVLTLIGNTYANKADNETANDYTRRAMVIYDDVHPGPHQSRIAARINLGAGLQEMGRYAEAEALYVEGLAMAEAIGGKDTHFARILHPYIARAKRLQGDLAGALAHFRVMVEPDNYESSMKVTLEYAQTLEEAGEHDDARRVTDRLLAIIAGHKAAPEQLVKDANALHAKLQAADAATTAR